MIADYFVFRKKHLEVDELYRVDGIYRYSRGFSLCGLGALVLAVLPNLPGFLAQIGAAEVPGFFSAIYPQAWFTGFALAFGLYLLFRKLAPVPIQV